MNTERIKCGGLIERTDLCLVEVQGYTWRPGQSCGILGKFAEAGISLAFLNISNDGNGLKSMSFCCADDRAHHLPGLLTEVEKEFRPCRVGVEKDIDIITLYGPHFYERVALASEVYGSLCAAGVDAHAIGSSVNSISMVVSSSESPRTRRALAVRFEWPE